MASSQQKQEENLLACLAQIKLQQASGAGPVTQENICQALLNQDQVAPEITKADLEKLVNSGAVITTEEKGVTTYSLPEGKTKKKSMSDETGLPKSPTALRELDSLICRCIRDLNEASGQKGVTGDEIMAWLQSNKAPPYLLVQNTLDGALHRELQQNKLKKNEAGLYQLVRKRGRPSGPRKGMSLEDRKVHAKRKRIKKSNADFEFYDLPRAIAPVGAICDYCLQTSAKNKRGDYEELLICKDCPAKAHASCMKYSSILARRAHLSPWQCIDCKTCSLCLDAGDPDDILFCDACDKGYHMSCHEPTVTDKPTGKWACSSCLADGVSTDDLVSAANEMGKNNDEVFKPDPEPKMKARNAGLTDDSGFLPTPTASPTNIAVCSPSPVSVGASRLNLPAAQWTVSDVVQWVKECGFPAEAEQFKEQEMDGRSLLLLMRQDVLSSLGLRLGPALKIYEHLKALQSR